MAVSGGISYCIHIYYMADQFHIVIGTSDKQKRHYVPLVVQSLSSLLMLSFPFRKKKKTEIINNFCNEDSTITFVFI